MAAFNLYDMFVSFRTIGDDHLKGAIEQVTKGVNEFKSQLGKINEVIMGVGRAFTWAQVGLMGFVTAGFAGSAEGELMMISMHELSMEIASIFLPIMEMAIDLVRGLTDWFRSLSGGTQDFMMTFAVAVGVIGTAVLVISKMIIGVHGLAGSIKVLVFSLWGLHASTGGILLALAALAALVIGVAAAIAYLFSSSEEGAKKPHRSVQLKPGGMEDITATYQRIQQTALKTAIGRTDNQILEQIDKNTAGTKRAVENKPPAVGR